MKFMGKGCWPSVAPDASGRYFYLIGKHTGIEFFDSQEAASRSVNLATIPGWPGRKLYHPRWTNDVCFITLSASGELLVGKPNLSGPGIGAGVATAIDTDRQSGIFAGLGIPAGNRGQRNEGNKEESRLA